MQYCPQDHQLEESDSLPALRFEYVELSAVQVSAVPRGPRPHPRHRHAACGDCGVASLDLKQPSPARVCKCAATRTVSDHLTPDRSTLSFCPRTFGHASWSAAAHGAWCCAAPPAAAQWWPSRKYSPTQGTRCSGPCARCGLQGWVHGVRFIACAGLTDIAAGAAHVPAAAPQHRQRRGHLLALRHSRSDACGPRAGPADSRSS